MNKSFVVFSFLVVAVAGCVGVDPAHLELLLQQIERERAERVEVIAVEPTPTPIPTVEVVPTVKPTAVPEPTRVAKKEKNCSLIRTGDGRGGFLYKLGEHTSKPVVLISGAFGKPDKVTLGHKVEMFYSGLANPDHNGDRHHFRTNKTAKELVGLPKIVNVDGCKVRLRKGFLKRHD